LALFDIFRRKKEKRSAERSKSGLDAYNDFWYNVAPVGSSGVAVTERTALKYLTLASCVTLISGDVARLPLILYRRDSGGGKVRETSHPLYDLVHTAPNSELDSYLWRDSGQGHLLLWGNHYSEIKRKNYGGEIVSIVPLTDPGKIQVKRTPRGQIVYKWKDYKGREHVKRKDQILHVKAFGFDGVTGLSPISMARETVGHGLSIQDFGSRYFAEGTHPSATVSLPAEFGGLGDQEEKYRETMKAQYSGLGKSHSLMILPNGETFTPVSIPMEDAQFIESKIANRVEICGFYRVPPHKVGIHSANTNRNNTEQENQSYLDGCLMHWLSRWETALTNQLLTSDERRQGLFFEFETKGFLRADSQARAEFYQKIWQVGAISANEIRSLENMNPIDGGDEKFVPLNFIPMGMAGEVQQQPKESAPTEKKMLRYAEQRSILTRDRIQRQYYPLFLQAAEDIVAHEARHTRGHVERLIQGQQADPFSEWLQQFYREMPEYIKRRIAPVFGSFCEAIRSAAAEEIGVNVSQDEFERFLNGYIDGYATRHVGSSQGQLEKLFREEDLPAIEQRVNEWEETRAEKIATNETTRSGNAIFQTVAWAAGMATAWRIRGAQTCPYCKSLNGKRVARGEFFLGDGDEVSPSGEAPMKVYGMRRHPPLHQKCDCYLSVV